MRTVKFITAAIATLMVGVASADGGKDGKADAGDKSSSASTGSSGRDTGGGKGGKADAGDKGGKADAGGKGGNADARARSSSASAGAFAGHGSHGPKAKRKRRSSSDGMSDNRCFWLTPEERKYEGCPPEFVPEPAPPE